jgi:hypothetical protein
VPSKPDYFHALSSSVDRLAERVENVRLEAAIRAAQMEELKVAVGELRKDMAVVQQQTAELTKRADEWDRRLWGLVAIAVGSALSLGAGLIVALFRK